MSSLLRRQPFKGLYLALEVIRTLLLRIPLWTFLAILPSWRPRPSWSLKQTLLLKYTRLKSRIDNRVGGLPRSPDYRAIAEAPDVTGVWVKATPELVTGDLGIWMHATSVEPTNIPGYWSQRPGSTRVLDLTSPPVPSEKVIFFLHGGGYVKQSAHPTNLCGAITRGILTHSHSVRRTFAVEYRLSSTTPNPVANPFPAALLDALAGYNYLVQTVGFPPEDIVVVGDSAGGNLALALTRYLVTYHSDPGVIPAPPGHLILLSPLTDAGVSHNTPGSSLETRRASDFLELHRSDYSRRAFLGPLGLLSAARNPYISPGSLDRGLVISFTGFPRTFIVSGGAEVFYDQILTLKNRIAKDLGDSVTYYEARDGFHDYLVFEWYEPERTRTLKALAQWIDDEP